MDALFPGNRLTLLPRKPLIIDVGCGPGTALLALSNWVVRKQRFGKLDAHYIGVEISQHLVTIGSELLEDEDAFASSNRTIFREKAKEVSEVDFQRGLSGRDGVIFALSYVLHRPFMGMGKPLLRLMRRFAEVNSDKSVWLLAQDANFPDDDDNDEYVKIWPETRLNAIADAARAWGYRLRPGYELLRTPHINVDSLGATSASRNYTKLFAYGKRIR